MYCLYCIFVDECVIMKNNNINEMILQNKNNESVGVVMSRYQLLEGRKPVHEKEYYEGYYENQSILFDRVFRGYRFTDEECFALCQGEWLEVHNLQNNGVLYGVCGCLLQDILASFSSVLPVYLFKVKKSLVNNPNYSFAKRTPYFGPNTESVVTKERKPLESDIVLPEQMQTEFVLHEANIDAFSDEQDSVLAAMIAASVSNSTMVEVQTKDQSVKVFIPMIAGYKYTENGLEPISNADLQQFFVDNVDNSVDKFVVNDTTFTNSIEDEMDDELSVYTALMQEDDFEEPDFYDTIARQVYNADEEPFT